MHTVLILAAARPAAHPPSTAVLILSAVVIAALSATGYAISIRRHPYRPCRRCGESGKHRGTLFRASFRASFRACGRCGGTGRELRRFAREPN